MAAILVDLFKHNTWANLRLFDACAGLSDEHLGASAPGTYGRAGDTLVHLVAAQERYVALLTGTQPGNAPREGDPFPGVPALRERVRRSSEALEAVAARVRPTRVLRGVRRGEPFAIPATTVLIQAINHATEHRAHVATVLSRRGVQPPVMDGWVYGEETAGR